MIICPICNRKVLRKSFVPSRSVNGKFIDVLNPVEVCEECHSNLKTLSVSSKNCSSVSVSKAKKYFNNLIPNIENVNLAAIIDLYVNYEEKNIIDAIVESAYAEYLSRLVAYKSFYNDMNHVLTSSGALGTEGEMCYYTPYKEFPHAKEIFSKDAEKIFNSKLENCPQDWPDNLVSYAIAETKRALIGDIANVISINRKNIIYYKGGENSVEVRYRDENGNFVDSTVALVCLDAFNKLIPEKEYSNYREMVDNLELKAMNNLVDNDKSLAKENEPENSHADEPVLQPMSVPVVDEDLARIKQLKELLDLGAISKTEYNKKKKQLLGLDQKKDKVSIKNTD